MNDILDYIREINIVGAIAILGLCISFVALIWNIIRDLLIDKVSLNLKVKLGGFVMVKDSQSAIFVKIGSIPDREIVDKRILFTIVNNGRKPIMIEAIGAKYKLISILRKKVKGKQLHIISKELPKMLQPYEIFNKDCEKIEEIFDDLTKGNIKHFFVRDTKGKYWENSRKNTEELLNDFKKLNK